MTDHATLALEALDSIETRLALTPSQCIAHAQAHATLAVANELHAANLLAFAQFSHVADKGDRIFTDSGYATVLRVLAGKALGLTGKEVIPE